MCSLQGIHQQLPLLGYSAGSPSAAAHGRLASHPNTSAAMTSVICSQGGCRASLRGCHARHDAHRCCPKNDRSVGGVRAAPTGRRREPTGRAVLAPVNPALHGLLFAGDESLQHTNEQCGSRLASQKSGGSVSVKVRRHRGSSCRMPAAPLPPAAAAWAAGDASKRGANHADKACEQCQSGVGLHVRRLTLQLVHQRVDGSMRQERGAQHQHPPVGGTHGVLQCVGAGLGRVSSLTMARDMHHEWQQSWVLVR